MLYTNLKQYFLIAKAEGINEAIKSHWESAIGTSLALIFN